MASITRRGDLQWQARVRRKGYPVQIKTFNTRAEAEAWARLIESEIDRGVFVSRAEAESTTLTEALDRYDREIAASKKGYVQEASLLRIWKSTVIASRPMASVRSADIAKLRDDWLKQTNPPLKPASVVRRLAVLSHVFSIARKEWGMESLLNPLELVRKPPANNARTRRIAAETDTESGRQTEAGELERVVAASGSDLLPAIIWLAVETAMRRGEIVDLQWEHVDLRRRVAHLPETKNGSSRDVPLSTRAVEVLKEQRKAAKTRCDDGRVFPIRSDAVTRAFERAVERARAIYVTECKDAGKVPSKSYLEDLRFHDLRHEATSRLPSSRNPACTLSQTEPDCRTNSRPNTLARGRPTWQKTACVKVISSPLGGSDSIDRPNLISRSSLDVVVARAAVEAIWPPVPGSSLWRSSSASRATWRLFMPHLQGYARTPVSWRHPRSIQKSTRTGRDSAGMESLGDPLRRRQIRLAMPMGRFERSRSSRTPYQPG
ncbi:phage integrase family protein [Burkholderia thailandensis MSMB121]|nr:phage integrase family protein [Burkholderia thailandensis MSMB121]